MRYRHMNGGIISELSVGTAALGMEYGAPKPSSEEAVETLNQAMRYGVTCFDTAPSYGVAEGLISRAKFIAEYVATKVPPCENEKEMQGTVLKSTLRLGKKPDIVQLHNPTTEQLKEGTQATWLENLRNSGLCRYIGASVYTEEEAMAVVRDGRFDTIQIAYNILDQRMTKVIFPSAHAAGMTIIARQPLARGALTRRPPVGHPMAGKIDLQEALGRPVDPVEIAIRFCLSESMISTVLVGVRDRAELDAALAAQQEGPLSKQEMGILKGLAVKDEALLDPRQWA